MTVKITDPSNPDGIDYPVAELKVVRRFFMMMKAGIDHDAGPALAQWAMYWARHKKTTMPTNYDEIRPIPFARFWLAPNLWFHKRTVVTDCSGSAEIQAALAGVNISPSGYPWDTGEGNSGSFWVHAIKRFTDIAELLPGDYAVYGFDGDEHISTIVAVKPEVMVVSHGMQGGPFIQPLSLDTRPRTFIRINKRAKVVHFPPKS
jgi:hypothetical protein